MSAQNGKSNGRTLVTGNAGRRIGQQLAADVIAKHVSPAMLNRAGISEDTFVSAVRQMIGYSSHEVSVPSRFGKRYDSRGEALWGRPLPKRAEKKTNKRNGKKDTGTASKTAPKRTPTKRTASPKRDAPTPATVLASKLQESLNQQQENAPTAA